MQQQVLLIANAQSVWTTELIRNVHIPMGHAVSLLTFDRVSPETEEFYRRNGVRLYELGQQQGGSSKIGKAMRLLSFAASHRHRFELVVLHSPPHSAQARFLAIALHIMDCKTVTVFWGSDIQAITPADAKKMRGILRESVAVNLSTEAMFSSFQRLFPEFKNIPVFRAKFAILAFSAIDETSTRYSRQQCKEHFGLDPQKTCIALGYNGKESQQHIPALQAVAELPEEDKQHLQLLLHMGYGASPSYIHQVEAAAEAVGLPFRLLPDMLDLKEIALLRRATDIMLHAQTNDALSGSVRECLYAGATLVNPTWIPYVEFDELGVSYVKYSSFSELPACLHGILTGLVSVDVDLNRELMASHFSWESVYPAWMELFDAVTSGAAGSK